MEVTRQQPRVPHFFKPILPGFDQALSIPKDFMKGEKLEGKAVLKSDNLTERSWTVNIDQRRFLCEGWKDFAKEHDLHIGDFLVFGHQGGMVFHVTVFDSTACERHYSPQDDEGRKRKRSESDAPTKHRQNNHRETSLVLHSGSSSMEGIKQGEAPYFTLTMNCSNIQHNLLYVPRKFVKDNGFTNIYGVIILRNKMGRCWQVNMKRKKCAQVYISGDGWKDFVEHNRLQLGNVCTFRLISSGTKVVFEIAISRASGNRHQLRGSSSAEGTPLLKSVKQGEAAYFTLTMKCSNLKDNLLYVPIQFVKDNGFTNIYSVITLRNKMGRCWQVNMRHKNTVARVYISGDGWKDFSMHNRLKLGNVCTFRLISSGTKVVFEVSISRTSENRQLSSSSTRKKRKTKISQDLDCIDLLTPSAGSTRDKFPLSIGSKEATYFTVIIRKTHLQYYSLNFPGDFARAVSLTERFRQVTLRDVRGSCWQAIAKRKTDGRFFITSGWRDFSNAHMLKMGDVCTFKLTSMRNMTMEFDVTIFQDLDCSASDPLPLPIIADEKRPCFTVAIKHLNVNYACMNIPIDFARDVGLFAKSIWNAILKDVRGSSWQATVRHNIDRTYIGSGWGEFSNANKLKVGDECTFKLISMGKKVEFEVAISPSML